MKNIISILITMLLTINLYSQIDYPRIEQDSLGQKVVVMTIEQAQIIDNKLELLLLFEKMNAQISEYDSICVRVINDKEQIIAMQDIKIKELNNLNDNKDAQISNLKQQIIEYQTKELTYQQ